MAFIFASRMLVRHGRISEIQKKKVFNGHMLTYTDIRVNAT